MEKLESGTRQAVGKVEHAAGLILKSERGATMVEYSLLVAIMSIGLMGVVSVMRASISFKFQVAAEAIETGGASVYTP